MLEFSEDYFKEETKCGFTISSTMKHAWAAELEVLQRILDICKQYDLTCYAFWGTLLGAVRHGGFIPWDDDLDVAFKREDYMKFLQVAKKELPPEYCLLNAYIESEWEEPFTRVTNGRGIDTSKLRLSQYHGCPFVVGVDIFPLDYVPRKEEDAALQRTLLKMIWDLRALARQQAVSFQESRETLKEGLDALEIYCGVPIDREGNLDCQLLRLFDRLCMMYEEAEGDVLVSYADYISGLEGAIFPKKCFVPQQMQFENMMLTVPSGYDEVLTRMFGDYMVPIRTGAGHDYPFYKEQLETMHEHGIWM